MPLHNQARLLLSIAFAPALHALHAQVARDSSRANGPVAITIFAEAQAREVTFNRQPTIHVRLSGGLDSVHVLERRNLPSPVVTGTTYRDVYVAVEIFGRLTAECLAAQLTGGKPRMDCASLELRGVNKPPGK
jgi:hypothetical protein